MVMSKGIYLVSFDDQTTARHFCQIKNMSGGRIFAVCRSMSTGKFWVCDLFTAIRLDGWYEVVV